MFEKMKAEAKEMFSTKWGASSVIFVVATVVFAFMILRGHDLIEKQFFMVFGLICLTLAVTLQNTHYIHKIRIEQEIKNESKGNDKQ